MSTRKGVLAGLSAAVAAVVAALWFVQGGADAPEAKDGRGSASAAEAVSPGGSVRDEGPLAGAPHGRSDALAPLAPNRMAGEADAPNAEAATLPVDSGLGSPPVAVTNTERFAQEIAGNLGWSALGPYEANQLGAEAAQFAQAREAALASEADGTATADLWRALDRSAEELAAGWMGRFGRTRAAQLVEYLGVTGSDGGTGAPRALDLDALARARRER